MSEQEPQQGPSCLGCILVPLGLAIIPGLVIAFGPVLLGFGLCVVAGIINYKVLFGKRG